jgi:hypothetical protein
MNLPFNNKKIYDIISKCFNHDNENYVVKFLMKKGVLNLDFKILFDGCFDINFNLILSEIIMKADSKMTLNFHKMESENNKKIEFLENRIKKLEQMVECLVNVNIYSYHPNYGTIEYKPLNSLELNLYTDNVQKEIYDSYCKIECFYQLNKLTLNNHYSHGNINFKNNSLKILILNGCSISSLQNLDKLPSLEVIEIKTSTLTNAERIIPFLHKNIKKISFYSGYGTETKEKLIPYCTKNKIELIYTLY